MVKKIITFVFYNSWMKTLYFILLCIALTYYIITTFTPFFLQLLNWRKKEIWTQLAIIIPILFLLPTFLNAFYFLKIVQIADNTKKQNKLIAQQNDVLKQLIKEININNYKN